MNFTLQDNLTLVRFDAYTLLSAKANINEKTPPVNPGLPLTKIGQLAYFVS
jgi:hypothetical protein